jgi:hypothetical protein
MAGRVFVQFQKRGKREESSINTQKKNGGGIRTMMKQLKRSNDSRRVL